MWPVSSRVWRREQTVSPADWREGTQGTEGGRQVLAGPSPSARCRLSAYSSDNFIPEFHKHTRGKLLPLAENREHSFWSHRTHGLTRCFCCSAV